MTLRSLGLAVIVAALTPGSAWACSVCGLAGVRDNWAAYGIMSVILSLLPLGMIGSITLWLAKRSRDRGQ